VRALGTHRTSLFVLGHLREDEPCDSTFYLCQFKPFSPTGVGLISSTEADGEEAIFYLWSGLLTISTVSRRLICDAVMGSRTWNQALL